MKSNKKLLSIVIPVYNVEKYIFQCLESIYQDIALESLEKFEVIIIDDCSPDHSIEKISSFFERYNNITLLNHTKNQGLGGARNTGILNASGKFITFIDSDDFYSSRAIEKIILWLSELTEESIVIFGFRAFEGTLTKWEYAPQASNVEAELALKLLSEDKITPAAWNKIYPRKILNEVKFQPHMYYEDLEFTPRAINKCNQIQIKKDLLINYRQEGTSITRQVIRKKHIDDFAMALDHLNDAIDNKGIFSNFFFNRWKHLLKTWNLKTELFKYALEQLYTSSLRFELIRPSQEYHNFLELLELQYNSFTSSPELEELYSKVTLSLQTPYPFFSIIIPVHNAGPFIEKAIENYSNQEYWNFELVIVDDKSTDDSVKRVKISQKKFDFIQLIELKENSGAGVARNIGLENARGKYIIFNDADDWFNRDGLQIIYDHLTKNKFPDVVIYSFSVYDQNNKFIWAGEKIESLQAKKYTGNEIFSLMCTSKINPSPWNKVFIKDLWIDNDIRFPGEIHHQDLAAIPYAAFKAESGTILKDRLYNYVTNTSGVTHTVSDNHASSPFFAIESLFGFFKKEKSFEIKKEELLPLAFETFDYNLGLRMNKFNDEQIQKYLELFNSFCRQYKIEAYHILNSISASNCVKKLQNEIVRRGLIGNIRPYETESSFENLSTHYFFLVSQYNLCLTNIKDSTAVKVLKKDLAEVKKQKAWYARTYDHLPKWFLKIGSIFRRL